MKCMIFSWFVAVYKNRSSSRDWAAGRARDVKSRANGDILGEAGEIWWVPVEIRQQLILLGVIKELRFYKEMIVFYEKA